MENEKIKQIENLIDNVIAKNFCENDTKSYLNFLDADLKRLQVLKELGKIDEDLFNHCIEEIVLLQHIIELVKEG